MESNIGLLHFLILSGILFTISVVGIFLNKKNIIIILMAIELMLLAVNFNFISFSYLYHIFLLIISLQDIFLAPYSQKEQQLVLH